MSKQQTYPAAWYDESYFEDPSALKGYPSPYRSDSAPWPEMARLLVALVQPVTSVDLACAHGYLVQAFQRLGVRCAGYDFSDYVVEHSVVPVTKHDIRQPLDYPGSPDLLTCLDAAGHFDASDLAHVANAMELLKPRAVVLHVEIPGGQDEREACHVTVWPLKSWEVYFQVTCGWRIAPWIDLYRQGLRSLGPVGQLWADRAIAFVNPLDPR